MAARLVIPLTPRGSDLAVRLGAGLSSGVLAAIVSCPAEVTLIRMSNDASMPASERRNYKHIGDDARGS